MRKTRKTYKSNKKLVKKIRASKRERLLTKIKEDGFISNKKSGNYVSGVFWSEKNNTDYVFRSTYEFAYWYMLENDNTVESFVVEPFSLPYLSPKDNKMHRYIPDVLILYKSGDLELVEIKPKAMIYSSVVQRKASAARAYILRNKMGAIFKFVTEEDIVNTAKDYSKIKKILTHKSHVF